MPFMPRRFYASVFLIFLGLIVSFRSNAQSPESTPSPQAIRQKLSTSPDGKFLVFREKAESGELGQARKRIEICSVDGKELYSWISGLGSTTLLWSSDAGYLAVNDMPGNAGDFVHVFHLDPQTCTVTLVREPDGKKLLAEEESRHGNFFRVVEHLSFRAIEWREGHLWCSLTGSCHPRREPMIHAPFHYLWVFGVQGSGAAQLQEEWTRTDPPEEPVRDQN